MPTWRCPTGLRLAILRRCEIDPAVDKSTENRPKVMGRLRINSSSPFWIRRLPVHRLMMAVDHATDLYCQASCPWASPARSGVGEAGAPVSLSRELRAPVPSNSCLRVRSTMRSITSTSVRSSGSKVFLDTQYVTIVDKEWVISSIRRTMAEQGILLENNKDKAELIVEAAFGAYGTDQRDRKFGLPGVSLTPSLTTGAAVTTSGSSNALEPLGDQPARCRGEGPAIRVRRQDRTTGVGDGPALERTRRPRPFRDRLWPLSFELASGSSAVPDRIAEPNT